jgi:hypothetical protein
MCDFISIVVYSAAMLSVQILDLLDNKLGR